ncbi:host range protein [Escherichia phage Ebrios]|uniref:Host range protein n=1 Tax=Escherichia phage Ebrios TaxID=2099356 RepID=A0A2P1CL55_9CAUD|nr:host range and adsorption protein [Escherichia phage Ebrios]AVJ51914.1 host range protein [Escherichia phage Ebrios]
MGKKITKAVKKVVREVARPVKQAAKEITRPIKQVAGALAGTPDMPEIAPPTPSAALVEVPQQEEAQTDTDADTAASRKKARAGGKKSLSVARSAGGGINI